MNKELYPILYDLEETHWWFLGRRAILSDVIRTDLPPAMENAVDIGCGTGYNAKLLKAHAKEIFGVEMSDDAIEFAKKRSPDFPIVKGEFPHVEFKQKFDLITFFDVLEHLEDDAGSLQRAADLLNPGGYILLTVPAGPILWSEHDEIAHHCRRYTSDQLRKALESAGFSVSRISHFNFFLFPPVFMYRVFKKLFGMRTGTTDFHLPSGAINNTLAWLFGSERYFLRHVNVPFGVSLLAVGRKK